MKNLLFAVLCFISASAFSIGENVADSSCPVVIYENGNWEFFEDSHSGWTICTNGNCANLEIIN
ncbi:MAG: hypothetical protein V3V00_14235 [Saprospiraceae bacterium]